MIVSMSEIRNFFDTQIKTIDPLLNAWDQDLFGNNDINKPQAQKYYNLIIGNNNPTRDGNSHWDRFEVFLDIYSGIERDRLSSFDAVYDKSINIKNEIIDEKNYNNILNDVEFVSAEPLEETDNDNSMKIRLNFIVSLNYNFC